MRWVRPGRQIRQVQAQIDPPDDGYEWRPYRGYPVVVVVKGKRELVYVYD